MFYGNIDINDCFIRQSTVHRVLPYGFYKAFFYYTQANSGHNGKCGLWQKCPGMEESD